LRPTNASKLQEKWLAFYGSPVRCPLRSSLVVAVVAGCAPGTTPGGAAEPAREATLDERPRDAGFTDEERSQSRGKLGGIWIDCYRSFQPEADAGAALARLTGACGRATGMKAITPVRIGEPQTQQDAVERFTFEARADRCYRVYGVGAADIGDLDVAMLDGSGKLAASDASRDRAAVVPPRGPLCAPAAGTYTLEVAVTRGGGPFALQVWGD
jgi:hypothetical protein